MPLPPGDKLGPYEILSRLGAGGTGEVWKARDTRLDRVIAYALKRTAPRYTGIALRQRPPNPTETPQMRTKSGDPARAAPFLGACAALHYARLPLENGQS